MDPIRVNINIYPVIMTSFGWKRKIGGQVSVDSSRQFAADSKDESVDEAIESGDVDWLTLAPKRRRGCMQLEDAIVKSTRLKQEGIVLADSER